MFGDSKPLLEESSLLDSVDTLEFNFDEGHVNDTVMEISKLLPTVIQNLSDVGYDKTMLEFFKQVNEGDFPLQNISFMLWMEVVKWFGCGNTSTMRYSDATKKFWKLGYRLFGGSFIHYMAGFKNTNSLDEKNRLEKGVYSPEVSDINFAVPDLKVLRKFEPYDIPATDANARQPGVLKDMIDSISKAMEGKSCCVNFDGKKLKQGLTNTGGEVDILGFEKDESISQKQDALKRLLSPVTEMTDTLSEVDETLDIMNLPEQTKDQLSTVLLSSFREISKEVLEMKDYKKKKEYAKQKLIERSGETDWRNGKYVRAISSVIALIHDTDVFLEKCMSVIDEMLNCVCYLNGSVLIQGEKMNLKTCSSYTEIGEDENETETKDTRQIKQGTDAWFQTRKTAKVTGSTMYNALGLDGLQKQKDHFDTVICGLPEKTVSEKTKEFLSYGTENEPNATATFVGKVMPALFPNMLCAEEGFIESYLNDCNDSQPFMVTSPDGSVRTTHDIYSTVAGLELKCPVFEIHKEFPPRYLLQCLAEIEALSVETLIYLSWRPDISTIFRVRRNSELFSRACKLALKLYGTDKVKRQTKLDPETKEIKEMIKDAITSNGTVEFVGLVPSLKQDLDKDNVYHRDKFLSRRTLYMLKLLTDCFEQHYKLKREPATEAVVFLCCDLDREWGGNAVRCAPVCWFPKGYSLDTETMRKVMEHVLDECKTSGLHVPAISFDGQWHNISVRTLDNEPLTILQLQRDLWKRVENMKRETILNELKGMNKQHSWKVEADNQKVIVCTNENKNMPSISQSVADQRRKDNKKTESQDRDKRKTITENENKEQPYSSSTSGEIVQDNESSRPPTVADREKTKGSSDANTENSEVDDQSGGQIITGLDSETQTKLFSLTDASAVLKMLQTDTKCNLKGQWSIKDASYIHDCFSSKEKLESLRDIELKVVVRYLKRAHGKKINESESKRSKISKLCSLYGIEDRSHQVETRKRTTPQSYQAKTLSSLAFDEFSKAMRKTDLNIIYSEYLWPNEIEKWKQGYPLKITFPNTQNESLFEEDDKSTCDTGSVVKPSFTDETTPSGEPAVQDKTFWFYSPSYSKTRQQLEVACIDSTHLLTRTRRKCCKGGIEKLSNTPWRKVAKSNKTALSLAMIDCIFEPMSVTTAVTHFSESVESEMEKNGDIQVAELCRDIRQWWKAEDDPGIPANVRVSMRMNLRKRLLSYVDFGQFPPPGSHINGWPSQLWEALVSNIDAKILLYVLCRKQTYNVRAFSSMMGETYFSELTLYDRRGHGTVTTEEFGQFIQTSIEKLHMRLDPERYFLVQYHFTHFISDILCEVSQLSYLFTCASYMSYKCDFLPRLYFGYILVLIASVLIGKAFLSSNAYYP